MEKRREEKSPGGANLRLKSNFNGDHGGGTDENGARGTQSLNHSIPLPPVTRLPGRKEGGVLMIKRPFSGYLPPQPSALIWKQTKA